MPAAAGAAAPPADEELRRSIEVLARFVGRNGPAFEAMARQRNAADPSFAFLFGGAGADYYASCVQATAQQRAASAAAVAAVGQRRAPLSADERGSILGESALPSSSPALPPPPPLPAGGLPGPPGQVLQSVPQTCRRCCLTLKTHRFYSHAGIYLGVGTHHNKMMCHYTIAKFPLCAVICRGGV